MDRFLYLLGAGASCQAIPIVKDFSKGLRDFASYIDQELINESQQDLDLVRSFVKEIVWLSGESEKHASIDTFAKKLYLKSDFKTLNRLKSLLSIYLVVTQATREVDNRYDSFFASIMTRKTGMALPKNIQIITWNYDAQLEKAFHAFCDDSRIVWDYITSNPQIYRLNGLSGLNEKGAYLNEFGVIFKSDRKEAFKAGISMFTNGAGNNTISFAWENEDTFIVSNAGRILNETTILIVIGYSFPFFNRTLDRRILEQMTSLKKVYLQYPSGEHIAIEERIRALKPDLPEIIRIEDLKLFHIPNEYAGSEYLSDGV